MNAVIDFLGRDTFIILILFVAVNIRAGKPEKIPVVQGLVLAFTPFFVVLCLLYIFEYALSLFGIEITAKAIAAAGGIGGYLGNSWLAGLTKNGKQIEEDGAVETIASLAKSVIKFKKPE